MTRYQLAKLVALAGTLHSRKQVQKIVYLLRASGLDFGVEYRLHHYGPYSADVASLLNAMVCEDILEESCKLNYAGSRYDYILTSSAAKSLEEFEQTTAGRSAAQQFEQFEPLLQELLDAKLFDLELASTIVLFKQKGVDWPIALEQACDFKEIASNSDIAGRALQLAKKTLLNPP